MLDYIHNLISILFNDSTGNITLSSANATSLEYFNKTSFINNLTSLYNKKKHLIEVNNEQRNIIHLAVLNDLFDEVKNIVNAKDIIALATKPDLFGNTAIEYDIMSNKYQGSLTKFIESNLYCYNVSLPSTVSNIENNVKENMMLFFLNDDSFNPHQFYAHNQEALTYAVLHKDIILLDSLLKNNKLNFSNESIDNAIGLLESTNDKSITMWESLLKAKIEKGEYQKWFKDYIKETSKSDDTYFSYHLLEQVIDYIPKSYVKELYFITTGLQNKNTINLTNLFLNNGIDLQTKDSSGRTGCDYTKLSHNDDLKLLLCNKPQDKFSVFSIAKDYFHSQYEELVQQTKLIADYFFDCSQPSVQSTRYQHSDNLILFVQMLLSKILGKTVCSSLNLDPKINSFTSDAILISFKIIGKEYILDDMLYYLHPNRFLKDLYCSKQSTQINLTFDEAISYAKKEPNLYISTFNCKENDHNKIAEFDHLGVNWWLCENPSLSMCKADYYY